MRNNGRAAFDSDLPDSTIVERIRGGEAQLYEVLVRRHNQRLFRIARAFLHEDADIEDVMQEAYLKAYAGLPHFQGRALFATWLTRILINCARERLRAQSRKPEITLDASEAAEVEGRYQESDAEQKVIQEELGGLIERAIERLPAGYRAVFIMLELEKATVAQTAACLGLSRVNVKVRHYRAKRLLRESLCRQLPDISLYRFGGDRCDRMTRCVMDALARDAKSPPNGREAHPEA